MYIEYTIPLCNCYLYKLKITCTHFDLQLFLDSYSTISVGKRRVEEESRKKNVQVNSILAQNQYFFPALKRVISCGACSSHSFDILNTL
ncbi:hypothetical protein BpHYR1_030377 [Brachionus plicatilis]|uniref:Uncharacterized protein n=1 Tax=Brachionus plicatilis TaxID=10195 RepID=A0A3M7SHH8_BRAPC|nr:hypothetical protein BpHYR1_030377 [Brachionus plicatilis]